MATNSTPIAAPPAAAAPAAAPASTSSPAVSSPASTPSTPVASPAVDSSAMDSEHTIAAMVSAAEQRGFGDAKAAEAAAAVEVPAVETPAVENPAVEKPAEVAATSQDDEDSYTFEEDGFVGAKDLATKLDSNEALKAALPADVRNEIMANARLAEVGSQFREIFASPEEAKIVAQTAQEYAGAIEAFQSVAQDPQKGTTNMVQKILEMSALRNADGTPMKDDKGNLLTDGTAGKFFDTIFERKFHAAILNKVAELGDENVQAALDLVMESVGMRPSTAGKDTVTDPALTARKAELDAQEARIKADSAAATQNTWKEYDAAVSGDLANVYDTAVGKLLDGANALDAFTRTAVEGQLESAIRSAIKTNTAYQMERRKIEAMKATPERRQAENALAKRFFRENLGRIAAPILKSAGIKVGQKVEATAAAQAARAENARSEVNGGSAVQPVKAGAGQNASQQREAVAAQLKASTGHDPSESEINIALMMAAASAKGFAA